MLSISWKKFLETESKKTYKCHNSEILDIILFGSTVKGKEKPNDIDILLLFKEKKDQQIIYDFRKALEKKLSLPIEVTGKTYEELLSSSFVARESFLTEGYSLVHTTSVAESLGFMPRILFIYELKGKTKSECMRFYYSLHGRNTTGILTTLRSIKFTESSILCPIEFEENMKEFFTNWNILFREIPILLPLRFVNP